MQKNFKKLLKYDLVVQRRMLALELIEIFRLFFIFIFFFGGEVVVEGQNFSLSN